MMHEANVQHIYCIVWHVLGQKGHYSSMEYLIRETTVRVEIGSIITQSFQIITWKF